MPVVAILTEKISRRFKEAVKLASKSDMVIAVVGEKALMSGESRSRAQLDLPGVQEELIKELVATGKPVVVVLMNGRPLSIEWVDKNVSVPFSKPGF